MKLEEWQKEKNISNTELAKQLGIHVSFITHLNKGRRKFSPELALKIEQATNGAVTRMELLYPDQCTKI